MSVDSSVHPAEEELLALARVDIGLSVAIERVGDSDPAALDDLKARQARLQRRMSQLQRLAVPQRRNAPRRPRDDKRTFLAPLKGGNGRIPVPDDDWLKTS